MSKILTHYELNKGHGWEETLKKLQDSSSKNPKAKQAIIDTLNPVYLKHLITGDRSIRLFSEDIKIVGEIISAFKKHSINNSDFLEKYPYLLDGIALGNTDNQLSLVDIRNTKTKQLLVFCSKRCIRERVEIPAIGELAEYSEVIGIKNHYKQCFDVVSLHKENGTIEFRLDMADNISADEKVFYFKQLENEFQKLSKAVAKQTCKPD